MDIGWIEIKYEDDLIAIASGPADAKYIHTVDIILSGASVPLSISGNAFEGIYDGNYHTLAWPLKMDIMSMQVP